MHNTTTARTALIAADTHALVIVDSGVDGRQALTHDWEATTTVLVLDPSAHGLLQLSQALQDLRLRPHLNSHCRPGCLRLGASTLDIDSLTDWMAHWERLSQMLDIDSSLALRACKMACGTASRHVIDAPAGCLGAEVTTHSRPVGVVTPAGDWTSDHHTGQGPATETAAPWR